MAAAVPVQKGLTRILLLHCNYNLEPKWATDTSLNLTTDRAEQLLESPAGGFDYILTGLEHAPADYFNERLIVVGNLHPTSLGDISDKRVVTFEDGQMVSKIIWRKETGYAEYQYNELPDSINEHFIRVKGEVQVGDMLDLTQRISRMWARSPELYCVKVDAKVKEVGAMDGEQVARSVIQLPTLIRAELQQHPAMLALWDRLLAEEEGP